jgi:hypothetical protein
MHSTFHLLLQMPALIQAQPLQLLRRQQLELILLWHLHQLLDCLQLAQFVLLRSFRLLLVLLLQWQLVLLLLPLWRLLQLLLWQLLLLWLVLLWLLWQLLRQLQQLPHQEQLLLVANRHLDGSAHLAHIASQHCLQEQIKHPHSPALGVLRVIHQLHQRQPAIQQQPPELTHRHSPAAACVAATVSVHAPAAAAVPKIWQLLPVWWAAGPVLRHGLYLLRLLLQLLLQLLRCFQAEADVAAIAKGVQCNSC